MKKNEELGSELSGMSVEIPNEIDDEVMSANFLVSYERKYKNGYFAQFGRNEKIKPHLFRPQAALAPADQAK